MFKRLRALFKSKDTKREVSIDEVPSLLDQQKRLIDDNLAASITIHRTTIDTTIKALQSTLETFHAPDRDSVSHPKLEKIAKTALPNFVKSMQQVLSRPLPPSNDAYYQEVSTILKGVINLMRGTGRYLPAVFQEEMKEVQTAVSSFGRSLNAMTEEMGVARERTHTINEIRNTHSTFLTSVKDYQNILGKISTGEQENRQAEFRIGDLKRSIVGIEESQALEVFELEKVKLANLEQEARLLRLRADHYIQPTLSVYRRALRIVRHQSNVAETKSIEETIKLLESIPACQSDVLTKAIDSTLPHIKRLIDSGILQLKNQEEIHLFSHEVSLASELRAASLSLLEIDERITLCKTGIASAPVHISYENLKKELLATEREQGEQNRQVEELRSTAKELFHKIELLHKQLIEQLSKYFDEEITLKPSLENLVLVPEKLKL